MAYGQARGKHAQGLGVPGAAPGVVASVQAMNVSVPRQSALAAHSIAQR